jgi:hypothetical protein
LESIWIAEVHNLVPSWVRNMSTKSHTHKKSGRLRKKLFSTRGYAEIHIQRPLFVDNKNSIWKILGLKTQMVETCSSASSTRRNFCFWKTLKSQFLVIFQSFIFRQILAVLGRFSCIHSGWEHAKLGLKSSKPHNFSTMSPNVTCNSSLESYHPYLQPQKKFQKIQKFIAFIVACPMIQKSILVNNVL